MKTKRFRRTSHKSYLRTLKKTFGFASDCMSDEDKGHYLDELRKIYDVIKQHKHSHENVLTVQQFHDVSPDYILQILTDIHTKYSWSLVKSVPASENRFLKAAIRIADRILQVSDTMHKQQAFAGTARASHPTAVSRIIRTPASATSTSIFDALCDRLNLSARGTKSYYVFAPSDACMNRPFYKTYFQSISKQTSLLKSVLLHHFIPITKLLHKTRFTIDSHLGYPVTVVHENQRIVKVQDAHVLEGNLDNKKYIIDSVLGVYRPFGLTVFQKKVIQTRITSICMLLSKNHCTSPCTMGTLTCSYANGASSAARSDILYMKQLVIQSIRDYYIIVGWMPIVLYTALPIIESVLGSVSLISWTRSIMPFLNFQLKPIAHIYNFVELLYAPAMRALTGISVNMELCGQVVLAPILEECIFRGRMKQTVDKILNVYPPPTQNAIRTSIPHVSTRKKNQKNANSNHTHQPLRQRASSTFEDMMSDHDVAYSNQLAQWASTLFLSLWFALVHVANHSGKNEQLFFTRWQTCVQVIITLTIGSVCHILTTHRGLQVSILRHALHNLLCNLLPDMYTFQKLITDTPPVIQFRLPQDARQWHGVQNVPAKFTNHGFNTTIRLHFPPRSRPNAPIHNLIIEYSTSAFNSKTNRKRYMQTIHIPAEQTQLNARIIKQCEPSESQKRGF